MRRSPSEGLAPGVTRHINLVYDLLAVSGALCLSSWAAGRGPWPPVGTLAVAVLAWAAGSFVIRYYDPWANRGWVDELALASLLCGGMVASVAGWRLIAPFAPAEDLGRAMLFSLTLVFFPRRFVFRRLELGERAMDQVLVVGTGYMARSTAEGLRRRRRQRLEVAGLLAWPGEVTTGEISGVPVLGDSAALEQVLRNLAVHEVYIAGNPVQHAEPMQAAIRVCERFGIPFALPAYNFRLERARPSQPRLVVDGYLHYVNHDARPYQRALKRLFDIVASAAALVALSPLLALVAALIKLTSRGPLFFEQERVGLYGRPFHMFKFRTMVANAAELQAELIAQNEQSGPVFKIRNDPRITPLGGFLRKHSIDELPQLLNVLRGDMSLVGPRPPVPREVAQYEPWQRRRLSVRPGLTCIWQVSGRNEISFQDWMYLDMRYIDHWSFAEDLHLILKTVPVVLTGRGAS